MPQLLSLTEELEMTAIPKPAVHNAMGAHPGLREFLLYFLRLGAFGFGGPIALVGYMQRDFVEDRKWISREDYLEGLAFSQLCPGPLAAQLAKYLGWVHSGTLGATLSGAAFILPSFLMVLGGQGLFALDPLRHISGYDRLDAVRDRLAVHFVRFRRDVREGSA